ncbi:unnamed protein product [Phytomonas sp. EM1]|nr:unnamed protein product [Phytomonas sp. EM1]|eukprot:CCW60477.1 unnamed protein product [Phytomonas sp. isolate EM1]
MSSRSEDSLPLKRNCATSCGRVSHEVGGSGLAHPNSSHSSFHDKEEAGGVRWEDSFEYLEYKPKSFPGSKYHWTDLVPSYSYLENDFYDRSGTQNLNFLAIGHAPEIRREPEEMKSINSGVGMLTSSPMSNDPNKRLSKAVDRFRSVFSEELRTKRSSKLQKLAFSPLEQQEWYIDEKLVRSEASKVEFMNELTRWNFKDLD